jgi:hypothetical protein
MAATLAPVERSTATHRSHYREPAWSAAVGFFSGTSGGASIVCEETPPREDGKRLRDVATTMIYTHVLNRGPAGVRSPADRLPE